MTIIHIPISSTTLHNDISLGIEMICRVVFESNLIQILELISGPDSRGRRSISSPIFNNLGFLFILWSLYNIT